jgi:hypothetical protein
MVTLLTNGAGGNDHLDLLQLRAASSLAEGGRLPERLETNPAVALDHVEPAARSSSMATRSTVIRWRCRESIP